jgi:hypothetical protein
MGLEVVPHGEGYRAAMRWELEARHVDPVEKRRKMAEWGETPDLTLLEAEQRMVDAVIADEDVLEEWGRKEVLYALGEGWMPEYPSYGIDLEESAQVLAEIAATIPGAEGRLLRRTLAKDDTDELLSDFFVAAEVQVTGFHVERGETVRPLALPASLVR